VSNIYTFDHVSKKHNLTTAHEAYGEIPKKADSDLL
jgi:hypothetical protein